MQEGCWTSLLAGSEVDIRTLLLSIVGRVKDGGMKVGWKEAAVGVGFKTRRFSNDSLFCLPRTLRHAGRCGLTGSMDLDQVNSHFHAQLARHPCRPALVQYVHERDAVLASVAGVGREGAKQLFLLLAYGGSLKAWRREHGGIELPDFVHEFDQEQKEIRKEDAEKHQELLKQLAKSDRPDVTLQSQLNMKYEREVLDGMALAVQGLARVASYEHDGMFLHEVSDCDAVLKAVRGRVHAPVSIKKQMTQPEVLAELASRWPHEDWTTKEEIAEEQCALIAEALQGCAKGRQQQLYARIVALELDCDGYPIKQVFKHIGNGQYMHWDGKWTQDDARDKLLHAIGDVLSKRLRPWHWETRSEKQVAVYAEPSDVFSQLCTVEAVERFIRPLLRDSDFKMDDQRQYVAFENAVYDRVKDEWVDKAPHIRSSHTTGWSWYGTGLSNTEEQMAERAVMTGDEHLLNQVSLFIPGLAFLYDITGNWERCIYLCKHLARATFAMELQEILWTMGLWRKC